jgi:hypothetical protein
MTGFTQSTVAIIVGNADEYIRPQEAPYKVSLAKIQILALKGGNFSVQKVENVIRVITCLKNIGFS